MSPRVSQGNFALLLYQGFASLREFGLQLRGVAHYERLDHPSRKFLAHVGADGLRKVSMSLKNITFLVESSMITYEQPGGATVVCFNDAHDGSTGEQLITNH